VVSKITDTQIGNFWADFEQHIIESAINEWQNDCGCTVCQGRKTALRALVITFDTAHYSDINTVCLKDLTFMFIKQHQLWYDAYLRIATTTASAAW